MTENKEFYKKLKDLMIPIAFQSFMMAAVSAGDSAMLGFVDEKAMAAVALAGNIQFVENLFLGSLVCGVTILTAQYWGKKRQKYCGTLLWFNSEIRYCDCWNILSFGMFVSETVNVHFHK